VSTPAIFFLEESLEKGLCAFPRPAGLFFFPNLSILFYFWPMPITQTVALESVRFFAFHGFYPEEQLIGNEFIVDIVTEMPVTNDGGDNLENTVNYERLHQIAESEMKATKKLLETVAHAILNKVIAEFPFIERVEVSIRKMALPLKGEVKNSLIKLTYNK